MGCILSTVRAAAAVFLGVVVFVGFLFLLLVGNFSGKLLNADFYKDTITGQDSYNRIYDQVLVDEELRDKTDELLGNIQVVNHDDIVGLLRGILPPDYLQSQVEGSIDRTIDYLNEEADELEAFVELGPPLDNVKPVLFSYIDGRIDQLEVEDPGVPDCSTQAIAELAGRYVERFNRLARGEVPTSVPSLRALSQTCRTLVFAASFDLLVDDPSLSAESTRLLRDSRQGLREPFVAGDTLEVLKVAARPLATPLMDDAIAQIRNELDEGDRIDLIRQIADYDDDITEEEVRSEIADIRIWVTRSRDFGTITSLAMIIAGSVIMGLIHLPSLSGALRWPGITLLLTGVFYYVVGRVLESEVPDRLATVVELGTDQVSAIPPSVSNLGTDLLVSFGTQLTSGYAGPSITIIAVGAVLFGGSFVVSLLKPFIPFAR